MSTMKFCPECNNVLYPKEDKEKTLLLYACRNCDHEEVADDNCVFKMRIHHSVNERPDAASDLTLPRTKSVKCSNCNQSEAAFYQAHLTSHHQDVELVIRYIKGSPYELNIGHIPNVPAVPEGEEGMTLFFQCCNPKCLHRWRD